MHLNSKDLAKKQGVEFERSLQVKMITPDAWVLKYFCYGGSGPETVRMSLR